MPAPTVVAVGAASATTATTTMTPGLPAGVAVGDVLVTIMESTGNQVYTVPTGWAHVPGSPNNIDTTTRLTVIWRRHDGSAAPAIALPGGDHAVGRMIAIRGCAATGNPWVDAPLTSQETVLDTSAAWPAITTTVIDSLILYIIATGRDIANTANLGAMTGGTGLTSITERMDNWVATGTGGGIGMDTAIKAATGSAGSPVATMASTDAKAFMTLALAPDVPVAPGTLVNSVAGTIAVSATTATMNLPSAPVAGNLLVAALGADKNAGTVTCSDGFTDHPIDQSDVSTSLHVFWKIADGSEQSIVITRGNASGSGDGAWYGQYSISGTGTLTQIAAVSQDSAEADVTSQATGTTSALSAAGLAIAFASRDSHNTNTATWTNSYVHRTASYGPSVGGSGAVWVAEKLVTASSTESSTVTLSGAADQTTAGLIVIGRVVGGTQQAVTGTIPIASAVNGAVTVRAPAAGSAPIVTATSGAPTSLAAASGTVAVASTVTGAVTATMATSGSAPIVSTTTGAPTSRQAVSGTVASVSTTVGAATVRAPASGSVAVVSATSGAVVPIAPASGTVAVVSTTSGTPLMRAPVSGTVAIASTTTGAPTELAPVDGTVAVLSTVTGSSNLLTATSGTLPIVTASSGAPNVRAPAASTVAVVTASSGTANKLTAAAGSVPVVSTVTGAVNVQAGGSLATTGTVSLVTTVSGAASSRQAVSGLVGITSSLTGSASRQAPVVGLVAAVTSITGAPNAQVAAAASVAIISTSVGSAGRQVNLTGVVVIVSTSSGSPNIFGVGPITPRAIVAVLQDGRIVASMSTRGRYDATEQGSNYEARLR